MRHPFCTAQLYSVGVCVVSIFFHAKCVMCLICFTSHFCLSVHVGISSLFVTGCATEMKENRLQIGNLVIEKKCLKC